MYESVVAFERCVFITKIHAFYIGNNSVDQILYVSCLSSMNNSLLENYLDKSMRERLSSSFWQELTYSQYNWASPI